MHEPMDGRTDRREFGNSCLDDVAQTFSQDDPFSFYVQSKNQHIPGNLSFKNFLSHIFCLYN